LNGKLEFSSFKWSSFLGAGHAVFKHTGRIVTGERIALPLSEDGETVDGILGITIFEDPKLTDEI
tara:strand:- start:1173 stop:1367 length:195 start_codon:yes stop_codon:yes gene_type:complete